MVKGGKTDISNARLTQINQNSNTLLISRSTELAPIPKTKLNTKATVSNEFHELLIPLSLQQDLLNIFKETFETLLMSSDLHKLIQDIKNALYERDFNRAFGMSCYLEVYSIRWSPSRALCYQAILSDIRRYLNDVLSYSNSVSSENNPKTRVSSQNSYQVICFGGGAAEAVAFGGFLRYYKYDCEEYEAKIGPHAIDNSTYQADLSKTDSALKVCLVDCAHWQNVVDRLSRGLIKTSSNNIDTVNLRPLALLKPTDININFIIEDILSMSSGQILDIVGQKIVLVTLFFTLNELYNSSVSKTTAFFFKLTDSLRTGSILLIVDSPGSYSETTIGSKTKKYPIHWLLDYCLLSEITKLSNNSSVKWVKLVTEESKWFRIPRALNYPIKLENMRYQIHLFRRV